MIGLIKSMITRWHTKFLMLRSVYLNKDRIRAMCESDDVECKALHGNDMTDEQWDILKVCIFVRTIQRRLVIMFLAVFLSRSRCRFLKIFVLGVV